MSAPGAGDLLAHRLRPAAAEPQGALVLLHGRGTDENDLYPVLDLLDSERRYVGATIRAPLSLPPGGRHWYRVSRVGFPDPDTFTATVAQLGATLQALSETLGMPPQRTVIGGFSQGAVMSYAMGLGAGHPRPAGVLAMSGFIPSVPGYALDLESRSRTPVMITHGTEDPVIGIAFGRAARDRLIEAGLPVTYRESAMGHTIDPRLLGDLQRWLSETLSAAGSPSTPTRPSAAEAEA